jgi:HAE1 family hydrophobic/amphiphilic exporter-1
MNLTRTAIERPIFILMLFVAAVVLGLLGYSGMRKELNPDVNFGVVSINTVYTGAGPEEVNTLVSRKIEEAVSGVNGIREVTSSSEEGRSTVIVRLNLEVDVDAAVNDVRSKVDSVLSQLPKEVDKPQIAKVDTSSTPVLYMGFAADKLDNQALRDLIDDKLKDRFSQVPGVSEIDVQGGDVRELQVQVRPEKLLAYKLGITDIQQAVANATLNIPSGHVVTPSQDRNVRVLGEFTSVDELRNMILTVRDPADQRAKSISVRLGDVADVKDTVEERATYSRINGKDAIVVALEKAKDGNTVDVVAGARDVEKQLQKDYKSIGLKISETQEQATEVANSLSDLNFTIFFGIFLVCLIVYIFLHDFRSTLIVATAIPCCLFITLIALKVGGFTINNLSMLALSLSVGVLVDDAIVVLENIFRHLQQGEAPREAALNGRMEIGLAALAITLADVVVFLPIAFLSGILGQFFKPLALGYVFAVTSSLFVSFTLTPMLAAYWYRKNENVESAKGWFSRGFDRMFAAVERGYGRALEWSLHNRWFVFILGNVVLFAVFNFIAGSFAPSLGKAAEGSMGLFKQALIFGVIAIVLRLAVSRKFKPQYLLYAALFGLIFPAASSLGYAVRQWKKEDVFKFQFFPKSDTGRLAAAIELPAGSSLTKTEAVVEQVEGIVAKNPNVRTYLSNVGTQGVGTFVAGNHGPNYAQVIVTLYDKAAFMDQIQPWKKHEGFQRTESDEDVQGQLQRAVGRIPGAIVNISPSDNFGAGSAIQLSFKCDDRPVLYDTVNKIAARLREGAIPGLVNIDVSSKGGKPEVQTVPDRVKLADKDVTVNDLATAMRVMFQGDDTVKYRVQGREYTIRTMLDLQDRNRGDVLDRVPITFKQGNPVFVTSVADVKNAIAIDKIERRDREEEVRINADLLSGYAAGTAQSQIDSLIKTENLLPAAVSYKPLGQADEQSREGPQIGIAILIGLMLVYMLLASLYDNLLYPLIIQMAQPQAFVGALLGLIITNKPLNLIGIIGLIVLIGLVGKSAILLVDYTNTLRERGRSRHDALVEAGPIRLRPILMTSFALVLGLMPVAAAIGRGSEFRETIGITTIGGMILSTVLTLFVIPCSYTIFDDLSIAAGKTLHRVVMFFRGNKDDDQSPPDQGETHDSLIPAGHN